jgi:hypothetical protein
MGRIKSEKLKMKKRDAGVQVTAFAQASFKGRGAIFNFSLFIFNSPHGRSYL